MPPAPPSWAARFWRLPPDAAAHGPALDSHLLLNLWIFTAILVLAHTLLFLAIRSHRSPTPPRRQSLLEALPIAALAVLFAALAIRADALWARTAYTGSDPEALQIEVVGEQFAWYIRYPGPDATFGRTRPELINAAEANPLGLDHADPHAADDIVASQLVIPVNRPVDIRLRALDVMHGFSVPALRIQQNAVPGQITHLHFTAARTGDFAILCTQVCGSGHYRMAATLRVVSAYDYETWLARQASR